MQHSIEQIIQTDRKARQLLDDVEKYRKDSIEELQSRREELVQKAIRESKERILQDTKIKWQQTQEQTERKKERNLAIASEMERETARHREEWIDGIVKRILG